MYLASDWKDYEIIDAGGGNKHERWADVTLLRPDPQAVWPMKEPRSVHARYIRSSAGGGHWEYGRALPESWKIRYRDLTFIVRPTGFKHTGLFPEQAVNWDWMRGIVEKSGKPFRVLNLFAYTGGRHGGPCGQRRGGGSRGRGKGHGGLGKGQPCGKRPCRRASALHRGRRDEVRIAGAAPGQDISRHTHGSPQLRPRPNGEMWKIEDNLYPLVEECVKLLDGEARFFLINSYTTGLAPSVLSNVLKCSLGKRGGKIESDEVGLPITRGGMVLPCGASGRWEI